MLFSETGFLVNGLNGIGQEEEFMDREEVFFHADAYLFRKGIPKFVELIGGGSRRIFGKGVAFLGEEFGEHFRRDISEKLSWGIRLGHVSP